MSPQCLICGEYVGAGLWIHIEGCAKRRYEEEEVKRQERNGRVERERAEEEDRRAEKERQVREQEEKHRAYRRAEGFED